MDILTGFLTSYVYRPICRNKLQFVVQLILVFAIAYIVSLALGQSYSYMDFPSRGAPKRIKRQTTFSNQATQNGFKDPFPNRPRLQTKNGHLIIEASQDKNIDFKTSGARGTITINGIKLDQLLNVTRALEKTLKSGTKGLSKQSKSDDPYEMILENIYLSDSKLLAMEKALDDVSKRLLDMSKKLMKNSKQISKTMQQVNKYVKQQDTLVVKLKRNDCFNNETGQSVCKNGATCIDTYDGFRCLCPTNFEGYTCEQDVDECSKFHNTDLGCQNGAKCVNLNGGYRCECTPQYHGVHCTEQHDDCSLSSSQTLCGYGKCINLARTVVNQANYECVCEQGWTTDGKNPECVIDINECLVGQSYQSTVSNISLDSSVRWSNSLMAAYPCSQNPYVECINLPGSFQCGPCPLGYTGNGRVCRDVDECTISNGGCSTSPMVDCINTQGSRLCGPCPPGFVGDGITCTPTGACLIQMNGGCHPMAKCVDLAGASSNARLCICQYPYLGDGIGPNGCKIPPGYMASNSSLNETTPLWNVQNDCNPSPCSFGSECQRTATSYECICPPGYSGKDCEIYNYMCGGDYFVSRGQIKFPYPGTFNSVLHRSTPAENRAVDQHYDCYWRISVAGNMSIQLVFNELANKVNPVKKIQMFLANTTDGQVPSCTEFLDVRERLDVDQTNIATLNSEPSSKLVARFCPDARGAKLTELSGKKSIYIPIVSNSIELEYTFSETRTQFGEPSLSFDLNWTSIEPPCGGDIAISESGSISSPNFPEFYKAGIECRYLIHVPPGNRMRLQFGELNLLSGRPHSSSCSDSLTIIDGSAGPDRPVLFKHCANNVTILGKSQNLPTILSSSSTVEIMFISKSSSTVPLMKPKQKRGFYLTYASESTLTGCGGLYTQKSATIKSIDFEPTPGDPNQRENSMLALQMSRYFDTKESNNAYPPQDQAVNSMYDFIIREDSMNDFNGNTSIINRRARWYKTRCEYEIRPANQARDHKISLDWVDMPGEPVTESNALSQWSRRLRCSKARLTVYDGNPSDGSNRTEIARFCSGDRYNSSSPLLMPVISSGHMLLLVYESRQGLDDISTNDLINYRSGNGFKMHYSTICSASYGQQVGQILVDINFDVSECIYHIMLPPNNTISMVILPKSFDFLTLPDGSCAAQAIFMDGAIQNSQLVLTGIDRQMKSFKFEKFSDLESNYSSSRAGETLGDSTTTPRDESEATTAGSGSSDSFWQYSWNPSYDIKEFEVCKLNYLNFDSIWNHLSLMFRINPAILEYNKTSNRLKPGDTMKLVIKYQAEPACGGIISEPREGDFMMVSSKKISSLDSFPLTASRYDFLYQQQFRNPCSWILRARPNQIVHMQFEAPKTEITKRYNEWLDWKKSSKISNLFNCSQVFQESIEIYEPSLNRTRRLCLTDLISTDNSTSHWTSQSNVVYLRLRNETNSIEANATSSIWPSRRPLLTGNNQIHAKYKFINLTNRTSCGGKLLHDSGILTSPRYPFNYPPSMNCIWLIRVAEGQQIRMNFSKFELEKQTDCLFDYLELRNGPNSLSPLIGRFCNQDLQAKTIVAHSSSVWLNFRSDGHLSKVGFEMRYDGALTGCGGKITTTSGQIDSPNYPQPNGHNSTCEWIIELSKSNRVELTIYDLDLSGNGSFCSSNGPKIDFLEIFDYAMDDSKRSFGKLCNLDQLKNRTFRSTGNKLLVVYQSQALDNSRGFRLIYQTLCNGPIELSGTHGVIESPGFPTGYAPQLKCDWLIKGPTGSNVTLNITDLEIEDGLIQSEYSNRKNSKMTCAADFLEIWARHLPLTNLSAPLTNSTSINEGSKLLHSICGNTERWKNSTIANMTINLDTNLANVKFESDRSIETKGFRIEWQTKI